MTLKKELIHQCGCADQQTAYTSVFEYIEVFYNRVRRHPSSDRMSPEQFEQNG